MVDRCKRVRAVVVADFLQDPNGACAGPVGGQMIELARATGVEGKNSVPAVGQVIAGNSLAGVTLMVDRCECLRAIAVADLLQDSNGA